MPGKMIPKRLGIDTYSDFVIFMRRDCHVCRSEGFTAHARVSVASGDRSIVATLNLVDGGLLQQGEAGLSESAWRRLEPQAGQAILVGHSKTVDSLSHVRAKIYGNRLDSGEFHDIISDIVAGYYSGMEIASFITACAAGDLDTGEIISLTSAMVDTGKRMQWAQHPVVDKHCIGGLPGNRTTPIVVAIVAACGLTMPKTSSRAITSPAGTADTMETMAPVDLDMGAMRRVVDREGGCIVWGGAVDLSPADDTLIRVERALDLDSEGQLIASVLSKKIAAGSSHLVIDIPVGKTAKIRSDGAAATLSASLMAVADQFGLKTRIICSDGRQPVGRGIGPALEALDVLAVLQDKRDAPADLRAHAITLAAALLELGGAAAPGAGNQMAGETLASGKAWKKFQAICQAQGGMRAPPVSRFRHPVPAPSGGRVVSIDNRLLARAAKLTGAPEVKSAGMEIHVRLDQVVSSGEPLFTLHADARGELSYAIDFLESHPPIVGIFPS